MASDWVTEYMQNEVEDRMEAVKEARDYFDFLDTWQGSEKSYHLARRLDKVIKYLEKGETEEL